jgi:hypothetical protein
MQPGEMTPEALAALQQQPEQPQPGLANPSPAATGFWSSRRAATFDHLNRLDASGEPCRSLYVLPGRTFGETEALALARTLEPNESLEELYASGHALGLAGAEALGAAIGRHPKLRVLCLGDEKFGADDADGRPAEPLLALARQLPENSSLTTLDCERKGVGPATLAAMLPHLMQHPRLAELKLGQNGFGCAGARALAQAARSVAPESAPLGTVATLSLVANDIRGATSGEASEAAGGSGAAALGDVLGMRGALTSLDASSNPLGGSTPAEQLKDEGNTAFAGADYDAAAALYTAALHCSGDTSLRITTLSNQAEVALRANRLGAAAYLARCALILDPTHGTCEPNRSRVCRASRRLNPPPPLSPPEIPLRMLLSLSLSSRIPIKLSAGVPDKTITSRYSFHRMCAAVVAAAVWRAEKSVSRLKRAREATATLVASQRAERSVKRLFERFADSAAAGGGGGDGGWVMGRAQVRKRLPSWKTRCSLMRKRGFDRHNQS